MSWTKTAKSSGGNFECCPAGTHPAVLIGIIDLGTQNEKFAGKEAKDVHKIFLMWEIPWEKTAEGQSHIIGREYTYSLHEMAGLRKMIESWRGKPLNEGEEFDLSKLLGKPCLLTVTTEDKNGKTFAKLNSVSNLIKGMAPPVATVPVISFNLSEDHPSKFPAFDWLPWSYGSKLVDIVALSPEWRDKIGVQGKPAAPNTTPAATIPPIGAAPSQDPNEAPF